jgi:predicted DNA-binding transcriptional regulator AlpA
MRRINVSMKLDPAQAMRLQYLADQCDVTPEQMASAVAVLALNHQLRESTSPAGPIAQRSEPATQNCPVPSSSSGRPTSFTLPDTGFLRLTEIVGHRTKLGQPPLPRLIPVSRSTWLAGVKSGLYPQPVKLGAGVAAWRVEDIRALIRNLGSERAEVDGRLRPRASSPRLNPLRRRPVIVPRKV